MNATAEKPKSRKLITPTFRVSFPQVFVARPNQQGKMLYSLQMAFPKAEPLAWLQEAVKLAKADEWGAPSTPDGKYPFKIDPPTVRDGDSAEYSKYNLPGCFLISANSEQRPGLINEQKQDIIDKELFYAGCYAIADLSVYAYEVRDKSTGNIVKRGISIGLNALMKMKDGEHLGRGHTDPQASFAGVQATGGSVKPENYAAAAATASAANGAFFD